jgi:uncharacterized protein (TIGR03435 family)
LSLIACLSAGAFAQTFDVASVKPSGPKSVRMSDGGPGTHDPERFSYSKARLKDLLYYAWGLVSEQQISGPGWLETELYDIVAKIPPGTTKKQFQVMLQNLLAERFKMRVHHETKEFPVYELVVGKGGPKLTESVEGAPPVNKDGFPPLPEGRPGIVVRQDVTGRARMIGHEEPISRLADMLGNPTDRVVLDKTGLTGKYDFTLAYNWKELASADDDPSPNVFIAVQQQLGLKLVDKKAPFDVIVVDHAEKVPTEN